MPWILAQGADVSRSTEKDFSFYDTAVRALEVMNCKIAASWMSLDVCLPDWLAIWAGVVVKSVEMHSDLLSR
jgi:hypothetical protein